MNQRSELSKLLLRCISVLGIGLFLAAYVAAQGQIVFMSNRTGNDEIFLMNDDGSNPVNLSNNPASDRTPSLSPNGSKIAFSSNRGGRYDIWLMNLDGSDPVNLTSTIGNANFQPSFSPDGSKIVFISNGVTGNNEILMTSVNGGGGVFLTGSPFARDPSFSPDGSKIVYADRYDVEWDVFVIDLSSLIPVRLQGDPGLDLEPSFSPDGSKIAFMSSRDGNEEIYVMNANGANPVRLTGEAGIDTAPVFSPDGGKIAFSSQRNGNHEIYVMNADGTTPVRLTNTPGFVNLTPSWTNTSSAPPFFSNVTATAVINEGQFVTLSGNMVSPDPNLPLTLTVNWGEGSPQVYNYPAGTTSFAETHPYLDEGGRVIDLLLTTSTGTDTDSVGVMVENVAPFLDAGTIPTTAQGSPVMVSGKVFDLGILDSHTVTVNWGDGSQVSVINLAAGAIDFSAIHVYAGPGTFNVSLSVTDNDGGASGTLNRVAGIVPPPTSGKIAFTSNADGDNEIWLMNSNGTGRSQITSNPASDSYPNVSKDGSKIVFISDRDGNPEVYSMNAAGLSVRRLTNTLGTESEPVFSPDGSKIVFASNRDGSYEVYIMNADGTGQTRLTNNTVDDGNAEFSPDGTKIIFSRLAGNQTDAHIYTMDLNGANQVALTTGSFVLNGQPSYSPDGTKIVFSSVRPLSHTNPEIYVMASNGTGQTRLTFAAGQDMEPAFSPDNSKIVFRSERDGNAEIYLMDAAGANQVRITFDGTGFSNFAPSWANVPTLTVDIPDDLAAAQGSALTVPINVSNTTGRGILSYDFTVTYDPSLLEPQATAFDKTGTLSAGLNEVNAAVTTPGRLVVSGFGVQPLTGAGVLLNLKFNVIGAPPAFANIGFLSFKFNEGVPLVDVTGGQAYIAGTISGRVTYGTSATVVGVPGVSVQAAGVPPASTTTSSTGNYLLQGFGPGAYTVTPSKSGDVNGIAALDASLISQFLVGAATLSPNQQIAADVTEQGGISSFDAAMIAQYVVALPNTASVGQWRFAPPSRFYEVVSTLTGQDYTAILLGEVTGNWAAPGQAPALTASSFERTASQPDSSTGRKPGPGPGPSGPEVSIGSVKASPGQIVSVPVALTFPSGTAAIRAYQFDVTFDQRVVVPEGIGVDAAGTVSSGFSAVTNTTAPGRLRIAVFGTGSIGSAGTLLNLRLRVVATKNASSALTIAALMLNEGNPAATAKSGSLTVRR